MATPTNLPASFSTAQILTAAQMNDLRGAFRILQVASATITALGSTTSSTYADTGLSVSITPQSSTSKVLVFVTQSAYNGAAGQGIGVSLVRGSTTLQTTNDGVFGAASAIVGNIVIFALDSPATTSAVTYKTQFARNSGTSTPVYIQVNSNPSTIIVCEVSA